MRMSAKCMLHTHDSFLLSYTLVYSPHISIASKMNFLKHKKGHAIPSFQPFTGLPSGWEQIHLPLLMMHGLPTAAGHGGLFFTMLPLPAGLQSQWWNHCPSTWQMWAKSGFLPFHSEFFPRYSHGSSLQFIKGSQRQLFLNNLWKITVPLCWISLPTFTLLFSCHIILIYLFSTFFVMHYTVHFSIPQCPDQCSTQK